MCLRLSSLAARGHSLAGRGSMAGVNIVNGGPGGGSRRERLLYKVVLTGGMMEIAS